MRIGLPYCISLMEYRTNGTSIVLSKYRLEILLTSYNNYYLSSFSDSYFGYRYTFELPILQVSFFLLFGTCFLCV